MNNKPILSLISSTLAYPLLLYSSLPHTPTSQHLLLTREAISAVHCVLITTLSLFTLHHHHISLRHIQPHSNALSQNTPGISHKNHNDEANSAVINATHPLIATKSVLANCITALETGYLIQDTFVLLSLARFRARAHRDDRWWRYLNLRVLLLHHIPIGGALGVLQWYIAHGRERGIMVILMFMGMNAS